MWKSNHQELSFKDVRCAEGEVGAERGRNVAKLRETIKGVGPLKSKEKVAYLWIACRSTNDPFKAHRPSHRS